LAEKAGDISESLVSKRELEFFQKLKENGRQPKKLEKKRRV